jgi:Flp pilus assembly pilin Flp
MWAWHNVIKPAWHAISWYIEHVLVPTFKIIKRVVSAVFDAVGGTISDAWTGIKKIFHWIKQGVEKVVSVFSTIKDGVVTAFKGLAGIIKAPFKLAFNGIAWLWNNTVGKLRFEIPSWVPVIGGKGFDVPQMPTMKAVGGSVTGMKPYIVGEQGPELFVPGGSGSIVPNHRLGGMGGGTVVQNITITSNDPQQVVNALIRYQQRNGSIPIRVA